MAAIVFYAPCRSGSVAETPVANRSSPSVVPGHYAHRPNWSLQEKQLRRSVRYPSNEPV
jgi:hypothetical protein